MATKPPTRMDWFKGKSMKNLGNSWPRDWFFTENLWTSMVSWKIFPSSNSVWETPISMDWFKGKSMKHLGTWGISMGVLQPLQLQRPSETVFGVVVCGLFTPSNWGYNWSTRATRGDLNLRGKNTGFNYQYEWTTINSYNTVQGKWFRYHSDMYTYTQPRFNNNRICGSINYINIIQAHSI